MPFLELPEPFIYASATETFSAANLVTGGAYFLLVSRAWVIYLPAPFCTPSASAY